MSQPSHRPDRSGPTGSHTVDTLAELQAWGVRVDRRVRREHRRAQLANRATAAVRRHTADLRDSDWVLIGVAMVTAVTTAGAYSVRSLHSISARPCVITQAT